ncbi:aspartate aminotransferase family protein [Marinococcus halophilus]|uniref:Putative aminotransferase YhxA n=1 Tax=Marinococcus halophilus TaxID=1371 RepID=A0A510Y4X3_MARHA|nr:aspartate aminotransferase family protein [Marinococcus halophilus]OZT80328.1 aspartate aminotransferase family protein [Marinococcus halophilus]GEK58385.1 putative aminotransferase YhxA [Marinococcus halophilus]
MNINTHSNFYDKDQKYVWHHLKPYKKNQNTMIVKSAQNAWITDIEENKYLDGMSGLWCVNVGYGREELAEAAKSQMNTLPYYPLSSSHLPAIKLSEKLNDWLKGHYKIFFSNSGSEANETAFKIARQYHHQNSKPGRYKFISRYRSYHGNTFAALSATGQSQRKYMYEPLAPGFIHVEAPDEYRKPLEYTFEEWSIICAEKLEATIRYERPETVAGFIMEPIITGGGVLIPHPSYVKKVQEICQRYGILLIIDEVICGFGRTGKKFGYQHFDIQPDIVSMAKGITSGYLPLAATAVKEEIYQAFATEKEDAHFRHVNTFGGNPAACEVALRNLEIMEEENLPERSNELGNKLRSKLSFLEEHQNVGDIRHQGLLFGIEIVADKETKIPASNEVVASIIANCKSAGLIVGKNGDTVKDFNNIITLAPPLSISDKDLEAIVEKISKGFNTEL